MIILSRDQKGIPKIPSALNIIPDALYRGKKNPKIIKPSPTIAMCSMTNGHPISAAKRAKIIEKPDRMKYQPNSTNAVSKAK